MNESLLRTIDSIDDIVMESEMNVLCSMMDEYTKIGMLMEYADETAINEYSLILESDKPKEGILAKLKNVWNIIVQALKKAKEWIVSKCKKIISKLKHEPQSNTEDVCDWEEIVSQLNYENMVMTMVRTDLKGKEQYTDEVERISWEWSEYIEQAIKVFKDANQKLKEITRSIDNNTEYINKYSEIIESVKIQIEEINHNKQAMNIPPILEEAFNRKKKEYPKKKFDKDMKYKKYLTENYMITESASSMSDSLENILNEIKKVNVKETIIPSKNETDFKKVLTEEINNSKNKDLIDYVKRFHDIDRVVMHDYLDGHSVKIPVIKRSFFDHIYQIANLINRSDYKTIEDEIDLLAHKSRGKMFVDLYLEYKPIYDIEKALEVDGLIKFIQDLKVDTSNKLSPEEVQKVVNRINTDIIPMVLTLTNISNGYITCYYNALNKMNVGNKERK